MSFIYLFILMYCLYTCTIMKWFMFIIKNSVLLIHQATVILPQTVSDDVVIIVPPPPPPRSPKESSSDKQSPLSSYIQTVPNHWQLLIIDDKSLLHNQRRASTRLLIFKIKFSSDPPSRWLAGSAEITPVIGNARRVCEEVTLIIELVD